MSINQEAAISWMAERRGQVSYSMDYRDGPNSYDCSSAVYYALMSAGAISAGWAVNTEYEHDWLIKNNYELIAENSDWDAERGDVFIWGQRGQSAGAGGHTGMFIDADNIIHCNYARNGISIDNYNQTAANAGWMYCYVYRLKQQEHAAVTEEPKPQQKKKELDMFTVSAPGTGIALMQGGHFKSFQKPDDPKGFWSAGVPHINVSVETFKDWQKNSGAGAYDDDMVEAMQEILKEVKK